MPFVPYLSSLLPVHSLPKIETERSQKLEQELAIVLLLVRNQYAIPGLAGFQGHDPAAGDVQVSSLSAFSTRMLNANIVPLPFSLLTDVNMERIWELRNLCLTLWERICPVFPCRAWGGGQF